jgi:hypothetical protein
VRVIRAGVDLELGQKLAAEDALGEHALDVDPMQALRYD